MVPVAPAGLFPLTDTASVAVGVASGWLVGRRPWWSAKASASTSRCCSRKKSTARSLRPISRGLEKHVRKRRRSRSRVASVASFFVSRIDSAVDKQLDDKIAKANDPSEKERLSALKGKIVIANAKMAYQDYKHLFSGALGQAQGQGRKTATAAVGVTGTKNKDYSDVLYVEELIGPNTINTVPPATLDAFRDHGTPRDSLEENIGMPATCWKSSKNPASRSMRSRPSWSRTASGSSPMPPTSSTARLRTSGRLRSAVRSTDSNWALDDGIRKAVEKSTEDWRASAKIRRPGGKDKSVWSNDDESKWLGWLNSAAAGRRRRLRGFCQTRQGAEFQAMPSCSAWAGPAWGPECSPKLSPKKSGFPNCTCSTSPTPAQVRAMEKKVDLAKTLFIVSSKSGGTTEPNVMKDYFFDRVAKTIGTEAAGHRFIAVTDPGSSLEKVATKQGFARIFHGDPDDRRALFRAVAVRPGAGGGRGHRRGSLIGHALAMVRSCGADVPPHEIRASSSDSPRARRPRRP